MALQNVHLKIRKREFVFIVGPSGSGKSTILKLILKEEDPTSGEVYISGQCLSQLKKNHIPYMRRGIGVVFQDFRLLPDRTVYENIAFAMRVTGTATREIRRQVPTLLALVGLSKKADHFPSQLSGGEQQRVALARALANNPSILIADEPTGNLDPENSWEIMSLLKEVNQRGTTVVVTTHEKDIVDKMKRRVIEISKGEIIRDEQEGNYSDESTYD